MTTDVDIIHFMLDLQRLLFHDNFEKRAKWHRLLSEPLWVPQYDIPLATQRDIAYEQLKSVANSNLLSVTDFGKDPTNVFTAHEMIGNVAGSTATKLTVHYNLFGGSIFALGTERHKHLFQLIDKLKITGCFCLTELGYGNNAVQMETTATYDATKQQFIIDSPTVLSQKYWITNGAVHANYALVFAQTIVKNKNQGINAFLVPIRDEKLNAYEGVEIHDMGYKIGLNGVDNAALKFHNVRVPRENLMNRYADVSPEGIFTSDVKGIQQRFFKVTERLLSGRLCIASMTMGALKSVIYNTIKYSQQRFGVSANGKSETPILAYQLQQNALIPIISRCLALNMLHNLAKTAFTNADKHKDDLLMICCVDKTLVGWHTERSTALMRERSGGQGFLAANMYGQAMASSHAAMTAEGDNRVLMIKVVKDYLSLHFKGKDITQFANFQYENIKQCEGKLTCLSMLYTILRKLEEIKLERLISQMGKFKGLGKTNYEILMFEVSDEIQELALAYGQRLAMQSALQSMSKLKESAQIVSKYFILYAWEILMRESLSLIHESILSKEALFKLKEQYNILIKDCARSVDRVVMSMNVPASALKVPISKDYVAYNAVGNRGEVVNSKL